MIKKIKKSALLACGLVVALSAQSQGETISEAVDQVIQTNPQVQSQIHNRLARDQEVVQAAGPPLDHGGHGTARNGGVDVAYMEDTPGSDKFKFDVRVVLKPTSEKDGKR